ncbi:MAG: tyrosine-type recombinase/integrase [Chlorobi bacterium]|nr:tyrosine-type recombinase/integrase [Chlorobiota bacterium]
MSKFENSSPGIVSEYHNIDYTPARLVKGVAYWYIVWYERDLDQKIVHRLRKSFNLASVQNKRDREKHASQHIERINKKLAAGHFEKLKIYRSENVYEVFSLSEAFKSAIDVKMLSDRQKTREVYLSRKRVFLNYIESKKVENMPVREFSNNHALRYLDHLVQHRNIGPQTYNNYIVSMRALFYEMARRGMIDKDKNPFVGIQKRKVGKKIRRAFTHDEVAIITKHVFKTDRFLALQIVLLYHCFIRPIEARRLRIRDIDINNGIIKMPGSITKNWDDAILTLPDIIMPWLRGLGLEKYPGPYLIFGTGGEPHPTKSISHNTMNKRHKKVLTTLQRSGLLNNIEGLSLYSWKDTGNQHLARSNVNIMSVRDQNRHKSLETTNIYMQKNKLRDPEIAGLGYTIIPQ